MLLLYNPLKHIYQFYSNNDLIIPIADSPGMIWLIVIPTLLLGDILNNKTV